jgi:hypothetical protein
MIGDDQFCFDGNGKHRLHEITVNGKPCPTGASSKNKMISNE